MKHRGWRTLLLAGLCALAFSLPLRDIHAGSGTLTTPAVFDTDWSAVGGIATFINTTQCAQYGLGAACTTAQLQAAGCTPVAMSKNVLTGKAVYVPCQIYATTGAGELVWAQDQINGHVVQAYNLWTASQNNKFCTDYKAGTITLTGAAAGEVPPCP